MSQQTCRGHAHRVFGQRISQASGSACSACAVDGEPSTPTAQRANSSSSDHPATRGTPSNGHSASCSTNRGPEEGAPDAERTHGAASIPATTPYGGQPPAAWIGRLGVGSAAARSNAKKREEAGEERGMRGVQPSCHLYRRSGIGACVSSLCTVLQDPYMKASLLRSLSNIMIQAPCRPQR